MSEALSVWTVYDHPSDMPEWFVARRHEARSDGTTVPTDEHVRSLYLDEIRRFLANRGLACIARQDGDDPVIVETWI